VRHSADLTAVRRLSPASADRRARHTWFIAVEIEEWLFEEGLPA
jgi:hypothetical protein